MEQTIMTNDEREKAAQVEIDAVCKKYGVTLYTKIEPHTFIKAVDLDKHEGDSE